jgi:hypothetical protein
MWSTYPRAMAAHRSGPGNGTILPADRALSMLRHLCCTPCGFRPRPVNSGSGPRPPLSQHGPAVILEYLTVVRELPEVAKPLNLRVVTYHGWGWGWGWGWGCGPGDCVRAGAAPGAAPWRRISLHFRGSVLVNGFGVPKALISFKNRSLLATRGTAGVRDGRVRVPLHLSVFFTRSQTPPEHQATRFCF